MARTLRTTAKSAKGEGRLHNRRLVLQTIAGHGESSRAMIARHTGLTPPTVSAIVRQLVAEGLIDELGPADSTAIGKPPQLLALASGAYQTACVDLSGPRFAGAIVDLDGTMAATIHGSTSDVRGEEALTAAESLARELLATMDAPVRRVCVVTPGVVDSDAGVVRRATAFDWHDVELGRRLGERLDTPTRVLNDSQALALAEFSQLPHHVDSLVAIRLARGVRAGIILHGGLLHGDGHGAGEIGLLLPSAARAGNETRSAVAVPQLMARLGRPDDGWDIAAAVEHAPAELVAEVATEAGTELGTALAAVVGVLDVNTVRIDAVAAPLGPALLDAARVELRHGIVDALADEVDIDFGGAGTDAVLRGAAAAVTHDDLGLVR